MTQIAIELNSTSLRAVSLPSNLSRHPWSTRQRCLKWAEPSRRRLSSSVRSDCHTSTKRTMTACAVDGAIKCVDVHALQGAVTTTTTLGHHRTFQALTAENARGQFLAGFPASQFVCVCLQDQLFVKTRTMSCSFLPKKLECGLSFSTIFPQEVNTDMFNYPQTCKWKLLQISCKWNRYRDD